MRLFDRMSLSPPAPGSGPRETLEWVRRTEILGGFLALLAAVVTWGEGWWHCALLVTALIAFSPWPGARAILRRAEQRPDILVTDPDRRRRRGRRYAAVQVPLSFAIGGVVGYLTDGWVAAVFMAVLLGGSAGVGTWIFLRWSVAGAKARD